MCSRHIRPAVKEMAGAPGPVIARVYSRFRFKFGTAADGGPGQSLDRSIHPRSHSVEDTEGRATSVKRNIRGDIGQQVRLGRVYIARVSEIGLIEQFSLQYRP